MNIPESIALQGVSVVTEYRNKHSRLEALNKQIYSIAKELKDNEEKIKSLLNEFIWNRPHTYYSDWKKRDIMKRHLVLKALTERNGELSFQYIELDNEYTSLSLELYHKGWLPNWQMEEYTKLGF